MLGRVILFIVLIPLIELVLLNQLLQRAGLMTTLTVVFATGVIGINLARRQGTQAWKAIQQRMSSGKTPSKEILDGVMILFAGAFLITPGIMTDIVGFSLLIPRVRMLLGTRLSRWFLSKAVVTVQTTVRPTEQAEAEADEEQPSVRVVEPK